MRKFIVLLVLLGLFGVGCVAETLSICSFNVQFLGHFKARDNAALASILQIYDIVVIQELVAPPYALSYPDGTDAHPDDEARDFFDEMIAQGFSYWLSEEDTGPGERNHRNTTGTEWWVVFYNPNRVKRANDLPSGFLAQDRSANPHYERVPYAFAFRSADERADFVLISVHLDPESSRRRADELDAIAAWIDMNDAIEKDFLILGDMNIQSRDELTLAVPVEFVSLNGACRATNTAPTGKPYDHVLYRPAFSTEVESDLVIVDLAATMWPYWTSEQPYPGDPYDHNAFRVVYSDHCPIVFGLDSGIGDDD